MYSRLGNDTGGKGSFWMALHSIPDSSAGKWYETTSVPLFSSLYRNGGAWPFSIPPMICTSLCGFMR